ncbi:unnamed protein product, partial [Enterobius vermicularis]|uniref:ubiquitinyl hydrolase 1 n=1 Tax=Enterobius vermicularis TaxID=51028 RepID=A0A0N4V6U1_ENTVE
MKGIGGATRSRNVRRKNLSGINIPDDLTYETAFKLYQLDKTECTLHSVPNPKTQNCRDNPYCLGRLGQQRWDKEKQQIDKEGKATAKCFSRRDVTKVPCGLVNLGNSCYLNSFIQIYFSDPFFRRLIYSWHPVDNFVVPIGEKVNIEELMLCLQRLFVTLQVTPYEDANAEHLAKLLQLDSEQHDALEFQILLFNKIEKLLSSREEWRDVKDAIVNRSKGIITQRISCSCGRESVCDVPFHPFILGIEKVNSLSKALEAYFSPEHLPDYVCPTCHTPDLTVRKFTIKQPPPVVTIQVNRFTLDAAGRKKKVRSALQYLREVEIGGVLYENCAVMVHEGPNADCGHYYDIIKHPDTGKWFTYNDEVVKPTTAPGVAVEKDRISKTTPDMKGCYALIYRRKNDTDNDVPEPPQHLKDEITAMASLDAEFLADKIEANGTSKKSHDLMEGRKNFLSSLFEKLQVKTWKQVKEHPESVVFLPTQLLSNIQAKEFEAFIKVKEEYNNKGKRFQTTCDDADVPSTSEQLILSPCYFELCEHGRVSLENILRGELKAVLKVGAQVLLEHYQMKVSSSNDCLASLKTGKDICLECVGKKKAELEFMALVDAKTKTARLLLREKTQRFYHADNCLWISTRSLMQYRKLAIRAYKQRCKCVTERKQIFFSSLIEETVEKIAEARAESTNSSSESKAESGTCGTDPSTSGMSWDDIKSDSDMRIDVNELRDFSNSDVVEKAEVNGEVGDDEPYTDRAVNQESGYATKRRKLAEDNSAAEEKTNDLDKPSTPSSTGKLSSEDGSDLNVGEMQIDGNVLSTRISKKSSCEVVADENETNVNFNRPANLSSKIKDEEDDMSDLDDNVIFNGDLQCTHGNFDFKCYETKERRIVVEVWEWNNLVDDVFTPHQAYKNKLNNNEDQQRRLQEIRASVGDLIRSVSRRNSHEVTNNHYTRVICADFIRNMISRFKSGARNVTIPALCQQCLLCPEHKLPYLFFDVERKALPLTVDEWRRITSAMQINTTEVQEIVIRNGQYEVFCEPCRKIQQEIEDHKRFVYEKGADIYVKLKSDENEEPRGENGVVALSIQNGSRPPPATRRAAAKNCMKFK